MSALPAAEPELCMTEAESLAFEDAAEAKHEYVDGHVYDWPGYDFDAEGLPGATRTHNRLQRRLLQLLGPPADAAGCEAYGSDMRLRVRLQLRGRQTRRYYYPDAMVLCDQELREEEGDDEMHVTRPCVIIEILSRRSVRIDQTEKLEICQSLPSVQAYLVVHQQQRRVERHWRGASGTWQVEPVTSGSVPIPCIGFELPLDALYAGWQPEMARRSRGGGRRRNERQR
jgi:Uma2 family endonuclease